MLPDTWQAAYDAANEQIQFGNPLPPTPNQIFDANGNLVSQTDASGTTTFTYNARNQLITINGPGLTGSFTYDALGRRVSKTVNGITTAYQYYRRDIVAELQGSAVLANYLRKLCLDEAYVRQAATGNEYYHSDALGSTIQLTDQAGTSQTSYSYEPFGRTSVAGASANPFQYTGRENDGADLYYYRARYYSPRFGRFLSEDPIRLKSGESNFYMYVQNNPNRFIDPLGLKKCTNLGEIVSNCYERFRKFYPEAENVGTHAGPCAEYQFRNTNFARACNKDARCALNYLDNAQLTCARMPQGADPSVLRDLSQCAKEIRKCIEDGGMETYAPQ